ncbi:MAG: hypothetical protein L3J43_05550 [Sulfurovum sp.]|nr:hypothetical protein [Sulfurovum sp.]
MERISKKIDFVEQHLLEKLEAIKQLSAPSKYEAHFKKVLYISFLESLAKTAFPDQRVKKRFINFIDQYTNWKECNYYCPVVLGNNDTINKIVAEGSSAIHSQIENYAIENIDNKSSASCIFVLILYETRNSLVHQFQANIEFEFVVERDRIEQPYYNVVDELGLDDSERIIGKYIEHIFPNTFLQKLSEDGLGKYIEHCRDKKINPISDYFVDHRRYRVDIE